MTEHVNLNASNLWGSLRVQAKKGVKNEPLMEAYFQSCILAHGTFGDSLSYILASRLGGQNADSGLGPVELFSLFKHCCGEDAGIVSAALKDLLAVVERDPAAGGALAPFLNFKGYHALQVHRAAHFFWKKGREELALYLQSRCSSQFTVDIHPAARLGQGIMMDHATGVVIGETAVVEDDVSMLHGVTLGGTGKEGQDRHPKIRKGALLGAGAIVLGNIEVGACSWVAAGSVVIKSVPPGMTVAGVPARIVGKACAKPSEAMDQIPEFVGSTDGMSDPFLGSGI